MSERDEHYIKMACQEAVKAQGQTSPNPAVGAVLVCDDEVISTGYHVKAGTPHAERVAIARAEEAGFTQWEESTIYVTLEPCSTHGRTGACSDAIVRQGIGRVVYGSVDPNPAHVGRADAVLSAAGIEVKSGVMREVCDHIIRGFAKAQVEGLPWVMIKTAMSLDGKITRPEGEGQWLTSAASRHVVHQQRAEADAIITGGNTVRRDNPRLDVRLEGRSPSLRQPLRVIFTRDRTQLPSESHLLQDSSTLIYETRTTDALREALGDLVTSHGVQTVFVEAGGGLLGVFSDAGLIDEVICYYAPMINGGTNVAIGGEGVWNLADALKLRDCQFQQIGNDVMMRGVVQKGA